MAVSLPVCLIVGMSVICDIESMLCDPKLSNVWRGRYLFVHITGADKLDQNQLLDIYYRLRGMEDETSGVTIPNLTWIESDEFDYEPFIRECMVYENLASARDYIKCGVPAVFCHLSDGSSYCSY